MPYKEHKVKGGYSVTSPHGTKAKHTTKEKADAQMRLLRAVEHGWKPTGKKRGHEYSNKHAGAHALTQSEGVLVEGESMACNK